MEIGFGDDRDFMQLLLLCAILLLVPNNDLCLNATFRCNAIYTVIILHGCGAVRGGLSDESESTTARGLSGPALLIIIFLFRIGRAIFMIIMLLSLEFFQKCMILPVSFGTTNF